MRIRYSTSVLPQVARTRTRLSFLSISMAYFKLNWYLNACYESTDKLKAVGNVFNKVVIDPVSSPSSETFFHSPLHSSTNCLRHTELTLDEKLTTRTL